MKNFIFFISLLHQAISYSLNSCEEPILFSDYVSITGPTGASARCSSPPNSMISMENLPKRKTNDDYSDHMVPYRRPLRRTQRAHLTSSLVQDQHRSTQGGIWIDICLPTNASSSATAQSSRLSTYAAIQLSTEYVIQLIGVWDQNHFTIQVYDRFAFNTQSTKRSEINWYSTLEDRFDQHRTWSLFYKGASQRLKQSFPATYLNIFPMMGEYPKGTGTLTNFTIKLYGCKAETTSVMSLEFKTSKNAISSRFGSISTFVEQMIKFVCLMAGLDDTPDSGRRVQFADLQENTAPNPAWTHANSRFEPTTLTSIIVSFRIMPTRGNYCTTDCRSAQVVKSTLLSDFGNPNSNNSNILQAIDKWIIDPDAYMCKNAKCPTGYSCVIGVCLTDLAGVKTPPSNLGINFTNPFLNSTLIDTVLNLSPLQVIAGVDQSQGRIIFSNHPPEAGSLPGIQISKAYTEATNEDESFHHRFMIPIAVVSSFTLIILGILSWKAYSRISRKNTTGDFSF